MGRDEQQARLARNEAIFRDANEEIDARAAELEFPAPVPFICECGEPSCREIIRVDRSEYEQVRAEPTRFLIAEAHVDVALQTGRVVAEREGYVVVEKSGVAAEVAERDARAGAD